MIFAISTGMFFIAVVVDEKVDKLYTPHLLILYAFDDRCAEHLAVNECIVNGDISEFISLDLQETSLVECTVA
jgi:hypothetical protein